uniref:Uncharacterized protein n=1 Tax=Anguilla anguilla TaxID=7936 RepID=A0A0E9VRF9_ANGAN
MVISLTCKHLETPIGLPGEVIRSWKMEFEESGDRRRMRGVRVRGGRRVANSVGGCPNFTWD